MNTVDQLQFLLIPMVRQAPALTIELIGLWFAFSRRVALGRASTFAIWGFGLLIANALLSVVIQYVIVAGRMRGPTFDSGWEFLLGLWNLAAYLVFIVGLAALAFAVFVGRNVARGQSLDPQ